MDVADDVGREKLGENVFKFCDLVASLKQLMLATG
jgi:hypothetical protein